jgi:outer membrane protein insertion porin family
MIDPAAKMSKVFFLSFAFAATTLFFHSCTVVKNPPPNTPFVYETNIDIVGKFSTDEKKQLKSQLQQQLDDSIRVRKQQKFLLWKSLKNPPRYDSINAEKSKIFMRALLNSLGYYRDTITFTPVIKKQDDELRTTVNFTVKPGKLIRLDSVWYNLLDSVAYRPEIDTLQKITIASLNESFVKKGDAFAKPLISAEFDRLSDVYRNNGFLRFSREELIALWDTVGINLLRPTIDPIEQAQQLAALRKRRENPIADMEIRLRANPDTQRLTRYFIGKVTVYPDYNLDTAFYSPYRQTAGEYDFISYQRLFKPRKLTDFIYLHHGDLYRQSNYLRTQNKFNSIGAWRIISIDPKPRPNTDTVDFELKMTPAQKYTYSANLEGSRNQGNILSEGNLIGLGVTVGLVNRNFAKSASQSTTNFRYGVELNTDRIDTIIQTQQFTISQTFQFPRLIPKRLFPAKYREDARTFLTFNLGSTNRKDYYTIHSFNTSWGYELSWKKNLIGIRFPNIEYNSLNRGRLLDSLIKKNASYNFIFNDGLIVSGIATFTHASGRKNVSNVFRTGIEESGVLLGLIRSDFLDINLYRFLKMDAEFVSTHKIRRTALAWRVFAGVGYELPSTHNTNDQYLPFFRQYYAGGPNSMRAWGVRKLGPGSATRSFAAEDAPDRFGDMRLELNGEYRYYISQLFGFNLEGALFTDIGNVWFLRKNADFPNGEFNIGRLYKDLAVGVGTGLRIDFGFLKARFDFAYKAKDPSPEDVTAQNKWFYKWRLGFGDKDGRRGAQFQLGIDYPF